MSKTSSSISKKLPMVCCIIGIQIAISVPCLQADLLRGDLIYSNNLSSSKDVADWIMEGPGRLNFASGWMQMDSPNESGHHVLWCPNDFPESFIAEWEAQNLEPDAGLCILFFAAKGVNGEDIFDPSLPVRDGDFKWYIRDKLNCYHVSYYANTPKKPERRTANLRKNNEFNLVQEGNSGIPAHSSEIHQLKLVKNGNHIQMFVDDRKILDWTDNQENESRDHYSDGKIGFRQMRWTNFRYRNLRVWSISTPEEKLEQMRSLPVIHPKDRQWSEPFGNQVVKRNPPILKWPTEKGKNVEYEVRLSRDPEFSEGNIYQAEGLKWVLYSPFQTLEHGKWYWQHRSAGRDWSNTQAFFVTAESKDWAPPSTASFLSRIPNHHPRVLVEAPDWSAFQAKAKNSIEAEKIIAEAEKVFARKIPSEGRDILNLKGDTPDKTDKLQKDASKQAGQQIYEAVGPLCKAYILTKNPRYANLAIEWALEAASWDPHGVTTINNFGDSRIMLSMALVVDTLGEYLNPEQKQMLVDATGARAGRFFQKWSNWKEAVVLSNHIWQHIFHYFFDTAIAMKNEHPDADEWLAFLYEMFLARAPILGDQDGGWVHGMSYFRMNMETLIDIPWRIKEYTGFDFYEQTPWYNQNTYYFLYGFPPGSYGTGFSDNSHDLPEPRGNYLAYADALSRVVQNPHAAWYRNKILEVTSDLTPHYQDYWKDDYVNDDQAALSLGETSTLRWARLKYLYNIKPVDPLPPTALPKARKFDGVGLVTMHSHALDHMEPDHLFVAMRSSPFGTYSHMLSDNNTFHMVYGGDRMFYHAGYKVAMSAPHRVLYYKHTRSHNGVLIDNMGQPYSTEAYAWFENFLTGEKLSYAVGNASNAYQSEEKGQDPGLKTFKRHYLMLRPDILVIYDELEAEKPSEWSYLLHSYNEIDLEPEDGKLSTTNKAGRAMVHLFSPHEMNWSVTEEYPVPAENWRGIRDDEGNLKVYEDNAWHFEAKTEEKKQNTRFLGIYQLRPNGETADYEFNDIRRLGDNGFRVGKWKIDAEMNPAKAASIKISNTIDEVYFASEGASLPHSALLKTTGDFRSAKLVERNGSELVLKESLPSIPEAAHSSIKHNKRGYKKNTKAQE